MFRSFPVNPFYITPLLDNFIVRLAAKGTNFRKKRIAKTCVGVTKDVCSLIFHELFYLKGKLILVRTRRTYGVSGVTHSLILNLNTR